MTGAMYVCRTREIQERVFKTGVMLDKRNTVLLECRAGGMQGTEGYRTGRMQDRTGEKQDRMNSGQEGCRTEGMQDICDTGQV